MKLALLAALLFAPPDLPRPPDLLPVPPILLPDASRPAARVQPRPPATLPFLKYEEGKAEAARQGKPLAVFVGIKPRKVPGFVSAYSDPLDGVPDRCVLVGVIGPAGRLVTSDSSALSPDATPTDLAGAEKKLRELAFPPVRVAPVQYNAPQPISFGGGFSSGSC